MERRFELIVTGREAPEIDADLLETFLESLGLDASLRVLAAFPSADDAATMRALAHPIRRQILDLLREPRHERLSPSMMARLIGASLGVVSYHVQSLLAVGLIEPAGRRPVRGAIEHFYRLKHEVKST